MNNKVVIGIIILFIVLGGGYFAAKAIKHSMTPSQQQPAKDSTTTSAAAMQEISVQGNEFAFTPSKITVKQGQPVKISFKNMGKYPHNFTLSDLNIQTKTIQAGENDTVSFTPNKTGTFTYICSVPGHADKGMTGTLTVK